jgi:hypothetical protein
MVIQPGHVVWTSTLKHIFALVRDNYFVRIDVETNQRNLYHCLNLNGCMNKARGSTMVIITTLVAAGLALLITATASNIGMES